MGSGGEVYLYRGRRDTRSERLYEGEGRVEKEE
jgi:hypothetical protein